MLLQELLAIMETVNDQKIVGKFELTKELSSDADDSNVLPIGTKVEVRMDTTFSANKGKYFIYELGKYPKIFCKSAVSWFNKVAKKV